MIRTPTTRRLVSLAIGLAALVLPVAARADISGYLVDLDHYSVKVTGMPDIDQRRAFRDGLFPSDGLPGDGSMYCVPTSCMNLLGYAASHGYSAMAPGTGDYQVSPPDPHYNFMTGYLATLGSMMGTDPVGGTGGGFPTAVQAWLDNAYPGVFATAADYADENHAPTIHDVAPLVLQQGSIANVIIGWYHWNDAYAFYERDGGHSVTLAGADSDKEALQGPPLQMSIRDPANAEHPEDPYDQSTYNTESYGLKPPNGLVFGWLDSNQNPHYYGGSGLQEIQGYDPGHLDGFFTITPKWAFTNTGFQFLVLNPGILQGSQVPQIRRYQPGARRKILGLAINPTRVTHPYILQGSNVVGMLDTTTGKSTPFAQLAGNPKQIVYGGRDLNLYALTGNALACIDRTGVTRKSIPLRPGLQAIAYDPKHDRIAGVSQGVGKLFLYSADLTLLGTFALPKPLAQGAPIALSVDPSNGVIFAHRDGSADVWALIPPERGALQALRIHLSAPARRPIGLYVDEQGLLYLSDGGKLAVFDGNGKAVNASPFNGLPSGRSLDILRSFSNFDPARMNGPAFRNVLPQDARR